MTTQAKNLVSNGDHRGGSFGSGAPDRPCTARSPERGARAPSSFRDRCLLRLPGRRPASVASFALFLAPLLFLFYAQALSAGPFVMSYGGRLTSLNGEALRGPLDLEIRFYREASGGNPIPVSPVIKRGVPLSDGVFQVDLTELSLPEYQLIFSTTQNVWVEVVDLSSKIAYPRQRMTVVPYAFKVPVDETTLQFDPLGRLSVGNVPMNKISGLEDALNQKAAAKTYSISDISGLQPALENKALKNESLGGDMTGTLKDASVSKILGKPVDPPVPNGFLKFDGSKLIWTSPGGGGDMLKSNNLSDLSSPAVARQNLGLGTLATKDSVTEDDITVGSVTEDHLSQSLLETILGQISEPGRVSGSAITGSIGGSTEFRGSGGVDTTGPIIGSRINISSFEASSGEVKLKADGNTPSTFRFFDADNSHSLGFKAPGEVNFDRVWTLPAQDGTSGQVLSTNGGGQLSWISTGGTGTVTSVAVIPPQAGITVSGSPVTGSGAITLGLSGNLAAVEGLSGTGGVERTAANTWGTYTLSAAGKALLDDADIAAQRTTLGLGVLATAAAVSGGNAGTITDGTITNDDISTTAAIDQSKISGLTPALAGKESSVTAGTTAQFYRGDKSWQDFNTAARGAVSITAPLTYNSSTGVFGLGQASAVANGYLSSFDFTLFYNKQAAITSTSNVNAGTLTTAQQNAVEINPFSTAAGNTGELRFEELAANGTNYVGFKAPDLLTANRIWTLPSADGLSGQVLSTDGNGRLSWVPMGSGFTWQSKSADFTAAPNTGYLVSGSNRTIVTLISTCNVGDTIRIIGTGTVGWRLTATGGSIYEIGGTASTVFESQFPSQAADLICSGTAAWRLTALSSNTSSSPLLMGRNPFITPGSHTWTRPTDVTRVRVTVIGGGGGGGGATNYGSAGGGGSGSVCVRDIDVSSLSTATINVGSGGTGGAGSPLAAGNGGSISSVTFGGVIITASGGGGGYPGASSNSPGQGGAGASSGGTGCFPGIAGAAGANGGDGAKSFIPGYGLFGGGGAGGFTPGNGQDCGAGGGGAHASASGSIPGGNGANGCVLIDLYQ